MRLSDETYEAIMAQMKYCEENKLPHFSPFDGICYKCHQQIFGVEGGITVEQASTTLITGCPLCNFSYCE